MENVSRMILVPAELSERLQPQTAPQHLGATGVLNRLDAEMTDILANKKLSAAAKWQRYGDALARYMHFVSENRKPLKLPIVGELTQQHGAAEQEPTEEAFEDALDTLKSTILEIVPKTFKNSARVLYDQLSTPQARSVISWDNNGLVSVKGVVIPESNIIDYVADLTRFRKTFNPPGWATFAQALSQLHLPAGVIGNKKYLEVIQGQHGRGLTAPSIHAAKPPRHATPPEGAGRRLQARLPASSPPRPATPRRPQPCKKRPSRPVPHRRALKKTKKGVPFAKWSSFRF